jgi:hypothetical protein
MRPRVHEVALNVTMMEPSRRPVWWLVDSAFVGLKSSKMKRFFFALPLFVVLLIGYWAWPFFGLRALAAALQTHNAAALNELVDFEYLRRYLTAQIIATYLHITGRDNKLGPFRALVPAVGASIVDPWVSQIINPENLIELLQGGTIQSELGSISIKTRELPNFTMSNAWKVWISSYYGLGSFSISLPTDGEAVEQFRLRMQLLDWHWKLTGIDLPERLRDQVARELAKKHP